MIFNLNHMSLRWSLAIVYIFENLVFQYYAMPINQPMPINPPIPNYWIPSDVLTLYEGHDEYNLILLNFTINNIKFILLIINIFYVYIGILNYILDDIESIVKFHILYILILTSMKLEYISQGYIIQSTFTIYLCLHVRDQLYILYKFIHYLLVILVS